jgi:hypothetical protein
MSDWGPSYSEESYHQTGDEFIDNGESPFISTSEQPTPTLRLFIMHSG